MNEIDLQKSIQDKISEKIRSSFVDLIPQETFDKLVSTALDEFINGPRHKRFKTVSDWSGKKETVDENYNVLNDPNTLGGMIMEALYKQGKEHLVNYLQSEAFKTTWSNGEYNACQLVKDAIGENSQAFVTALFSNLIQQAFMTTVNNMNNIQRPIFP